MKRLLIAALVALACLAGGGTAEAQTPTTGFIDKSIKMESGSFLYTVYVPRNYSRDKKWPVILFLHGSGERGSDGLKQTQVGLGTAVRLFPERYPAVVVMPQCHTDARWDGKMAELAVQALDQTVSEYNGDPDRLYLTGLSMGGAGSWNIGVKHPEKFAAVVAICGGGDPSIVAPKLAKTPVWIFVGDQDRPQLVTGLRQMTEALKTAGGNVKYTEYPGVPHNSWDKAYAEPGLAEWLFAQKRNPQ